MPYGWEGEKVRLAPLDKDKHLANAQRWVNDPEVTRWTLIGDWPLTMVAEERWLEQAAQVSEAGVTFAIETLEGEHIGMSGIDRIEWRHGMGTTGSLIGPAEYRGRGYGTDAARVRTRYAFEVLGLRLLLSEAMADNVASVKMLKRTGYHEIGRIPRRYWKRGAWRDVVLFAFDRDWWEPTAED